jgi:hypothetical protein
MDSSKKIEEDMEEKHSYVRQHLQEHLVQNRHIESRLDSFEKLQVDGCDKVERLQSMVEKLQIDSLDKIEKIQKMLQEQVSEFREIQHLHGSTLSSKVLSNMLPPSNEPVYQQQFSPEISPK